jgi:hypothetical protein
MSLTACHRRGGGGETPPAITNNAQGAQAASSSMQGAAMAHGSSTAFLNLASVGLSAIGVGTPQLRTPGAFKAGPAMSRAVKMTERLSKSRAANTAASAIMRATFPSTGSASCADGGLTTWVMIFDDVTGVYTADITFANCREDDSVLDGVYHMTATVSGTGAADLAITFGPSTAFTLSNYSPGYGSLITKAVLSGFSLAINAATAPDASNLGVTMTASGEMHVHDYFSLEDYELAFSNGYTIAAVMSLPVGETVSLIANGDFSETWADASGSNSAAVSFRDLKLDVAATEAQDDTLINGVFSIAFAPADCLNGTFTVATSAALRYDNISGHAVSGAMTVDGVTTLLFNPDGSLAVTTGADSRTYGSQYELGQECPFATLDEPAPISSGLTGTASAANAGTTITLTWNGPGGLSRSDMDLHMNYYVTTAPTATTAGTWFIDYHSGGSCVNPSGLDLGFDRVDVNGDGVCDIGLDYDTTSGFGPEHITATQLPAGYYVLSVNAFSSSDAEVPVNVSIQIGGSMFGPFKNTFAAANSIADGDGVNPAAWFAVADMVVDAAGRVTVQAHDPALQLWHDGAFGMFAPKGAKGL